MLQHSSGNIKERLKPKMAKQKKFYYIGVQTDSGMALVTGIDNKNRMCFWNTNDKPMKFSASTAKSLAEGLCMNLITAVVVQSFFELEGHFTKGGDE